MNRTFLAVCGAAVLSAALVGAQEKPAVDSNSNSGTSNANAVTFTGCLSSGSNQDSYYLTSAKQKGVKNSDKSVKIIAATPKVKLEPFVTQEVEVSGTIDQPATASGTGPGSQVRTLTVTKVKSRSQYCG
jgi:hypothetical protein